MLQFFKKFLKKCSNILVLENNTFEDKVQDENNVIQEGEESESYINDEYKEPLIDNKLEDNDDIKVEMNIEQTGEMKTPLKEFQCDQCFKHCKDKKHFEHHKQYHKYYLNGEQITCEICNETMPKKWLQRHKLRKHVDKNDKSFACDKCSYSTYLRELLLEHINRRHFKNDTGDFF